MCGGYIMNLLYKFITFRKVAKRDYVYMMFLFLYQLFIVYFVLFPTPFCFLFHP